jgi:apolipoprotein N-acyltransferase
LRESIRVIGAWFLTIGAVVTLVGAWSVPSTTTCAVLGWTSALLWCAALAVPARRLRRMYVAGALTYCGGFYWLYDTIADFGGFPPIAALSIFGLFACGSAIQFLIWGFIFEHLPESLSKWGLRAPLAWLVAHRFWIKIFPWDFGHTQIEFLPFAQLAAIGGVTLVTFVMLWISEVVARSKVSTLPAKLLAAAGAMASLAYGWTVTDRLPEKFGAPVKTVMIQGNISLEQKHNIKLPVVNVARYFEISKKVSEPDTLIIWPESTITRPVPGTATDVRFVELLPFLNDGSAFLVGALTYLPPEEFFNSSVLIRPDGSIATPYNKMILMPFGEYTPFSSWFPWLKDINATAGEFTAGKAPSVLSYKLSSGAEVKLSPLICYEDVIPTLARDSVRAGAELLVNQTNDAWFGDTIAPYQHHMIASFRAIENRRYLLRSTNTGLTAVVDPLGRTLASLPIYSESTLPMEVNVISEQTWYTRVPVEAGWLMIAVLTLLAALTDIKRK